MAFVLDSYHWYCTNDPLENLRSVKADEIVPIDINDARAIFNHIEQVGRRRRRRLATEVVNLK